MRRIGMPLVMLSLAACSGAEEIEQQESPASSSQHAIKSTNDISPRQLEDSDLLRVCMAGQHHAVGTPIAIMKSSVTARDIVRISYTRDDGKAFQYDCRVSGNVIQFRMIDEAGPGSGPGSWSGRGSTLKFEIDPEGVTLNTTFFDGSTDSERVKI